MKKLLLFTAAALTMGLVNAQMTVTSTGVTFTGNTPPSGSQTGYFYTYQPNNGGGTFYIDGGCSTAGAQPGDVGGFDPTVYDATTAASSRPGVIFYGGMIRTVYYGTPCAPQYPSFGFHTGSASGGIASGANVDLSLAANQKIKFTYQSDLAVTLSLQLFDQTYTSKLNSGANISLLGDGVQHTITLDFSSYIQGGADMTNVRQISLTYTSDVASGNFGISLADIQVGSAVVAATNKAAANITGSKLYPNPVSDVANIELDLISTSDVKVTVSDMMSKEVAVIADGKYTSVKKSLDVTSFAKGIYTVNYFINGAPAKAEMLVVK